MPFHTLRDESMWGKSRSRFGFAQTKVDWPIYGGPEKTQNELDTSSFQKYCELTLINDRISDEDQEYTFGAIQSSSEDISYYSPVVAELSSDFS